MNRTALVLAAHGTCMEPAAIELVGGIAEKMSRTGCFEEVRPAFHLGDPSFATVLDTLVADDVIVVPVMCGEGHFSQVVLPRELTRNKRYDSIRIRQTDPVGTHVGMLDLAVARVRELCHQFKVRLQTATIAVVGHGTKRHANSRTATDQLALRMRQEQLCSSVITAFLDDDPPVETVALCSPESTLLVIPFFIGGGLHALHDVPTRLGLSVEVNNPRPVAGIVHGRLVVCDRAIGEDPQVADIVLDLALRGASFAPFHASKVAPRTHRNINEPASTRR